MSTWAVPSEIEILRTEVATLANLLAVHEEQANRQFELIRAQRSDLQARARSLDALNRDLSNAASFLREIYRAMPGALIVFDSTGVVLSANEAAASLTERAEADLVGVPVRTLFDTVDAFDVTRLGSLAPEHRVLRSENLLISKPGARIPVLVCAALSGAESPEADTRRVVCIALDMRDRKRLELELRQAQKLESVGRLAAGVAHEINTPVQFVGDSIHFLQDAAADLFGVLDKLQRVSRSVLDGAPSPEAAAEAAAAEDAADLPYLLENIPKAFERSLDGLSRVAAIVRSLKDFAHPDSREMAATDLNRAVQSTLTIARNEYKYVAELDLDLGELPAVICHVGEINQTVLNVVVNAAHAIGDVVKGSGAMGRITVRTRCDGDHVVIAISDTGGGIPDAIREQVFDPFFTTKEVGRGTGQGLAIARAVVVDKHGGDLSFDSVVGEGTTFLIRLPIDGPAALAGAREAR